MDLIREMLDRQGSVLTSTVPKDLTNGNLGRSGRRDDVTPFRVH